MASENVTSNRGDHKILVVGLACLDIINVLEHYPVEDTENRVQDLLLARGGNAANTSIVLSQLGVRTEFLGTFAQNMLSELMVEDFNTYGVHIAHCVYHENCKPPVSSVIINSTSGTRTILHQNRILPELKYEDFELLDLKEYAWIHFEGRNIHEVVKMINRIDMYNGQFGESRQRIQISVELEQTKRQASLNELLPKADVVFISKDIAREHYCRSGEECVLKFRNTVKQDAVIVCAWGELGAWAIGSNGKCVHSPAYPKGKVVDTLGAGDTFNAGVIYSIYRGASLLDAVTQGCKVAGDKIGHRGFKIGAETICSMHIGAL